MIWTMKHAWWNAKSQTLDMLLDDMNKFEIGFDVIYKTCKLQK